MTPNKELRRAARQTLKGHWGEAIILSIILLIICGLSFGLILFPLQLENALALELIDPIYEIFIILPALFVYMVVFLRLIHRPETQLHISFFKKFFSNYGRSLASMLIFFIIIYAIAIAAFIVSLVLAVVSYPIFGSEADLNTISDIQSFYGLRRALHSGSFLLLIGLISLITLILMIPAYIYYYSIILFPYVIQEHPDIDIRDAFRQSKKIMRGRKWRLFMLDLSFIGWALLTIITCGLGFLFLAPYQCTARAHFYLAAKKEYKEINYNYTEGEN